MKRFIIILFTYLLSMSSYGQLGINYPNGGELVERGGTYQIRWVHLSLVGSPTPYFRIDLEKSGQVVATIGPTELEGSVANGFYYYNWTIGSSEDLGSDYRIRIIELDNNVFPGSTRPPTGIEYLSSEPFSICDNCGNTLDVTSPLGGESYEQGDILRITWDGITATGDYSFSLEDDQGVSTPITTLSGFFGRRYNYTIPSSVMDKLYRLKMVNDGNTYYSDGYFSIGYSIPQLNTTETRTFTYVDSERQLLSESKIFFDGSGKLLQSQVRNLTEQEVLATEPIYDKYYRAAVETLPAPTGLSNIFYKEGFVTKDGEKYNFSHFDKAVPDAVDDDESGTLGWYYSVNNTMEPNTAVSKYPYSRMEYYDDGTGEMERSAGPGDVFHTDDNKKTYSKTFSVLNDLDGVYLQVRNLLLGSQTTTLNSELVKTVSRDANGVEMVFYRDASGKVLAEGYAHLTDTERQAYPIAYDEIWVNNYSFIDIHIPVSMVFNHNSGKVIDLSDNSVVSQTNDFTPKDVTLTKGFYRCEDCFKVKYSYNYYNLSFNFYDNKGRAILSVSPKGVGWLLANAGTLSEAQVQWDRSNPDDFTIPYATYYAYDFEGRLLSMKEPDAGITNYMYRADGSIRFSENALQRANDRFSYTNYDQSGRPVESGEYVGALTYGAGLNSILENTDEGGGLVFSPEDRDDWVRTYYDLPDDAVTESFNPVGIESDIELRSYSAANNVVVASNSITLREGFSVTAGNEFSGSIDPDASAPDFALPSLQEYTYGAVSYAENEHTKTWYSYDELGRVKWMATWYKQLFDEPKVISYYYDFIGNVTSVKYQDRQDDSFYHQYEYDADNRLSKVYASEEVIDAGQDNSDKLQASYEYYLHGPLKSVKLANGLQNIDYYYTIQGWLKSINDPDNMYFKGQLDDRFAQTFNYFNGDYASRDTDLNSAGIVNEQFTGNIAGLDWQTIRSTSRGHTTTGSFNYIYDNQYQLKEATDGTDKYRVNNLSYDPNGNIKTLRRYDGSGSIKDAFTYGYTNQYTNQLTSVSGYATQYVYDQIGQMTQQSLTDGTVMKPKYDVSGKVEEIYDENNVLKLIYEYDDRGFRIRKRDIAGGGKETIYVRDASGQLLSTYIREINESVYKQEETPVYGSGKLGLWLHDESGTPDVSFELKDHLGNIRALLSRNDDHVTYAADYYPFGSVMREFGSKSRYGYQGDFAEKDEETGWNHFELREYDPIVGRWLRVDPMRQYWSPYNGNGNNPIFNIDPTGGENPIYGSNGVFRGVDEFGLQGEAIVYDGAFTNGMSQASILKNGGSYFSRFDFSSNYDVASAISQHASTLSARPDWDGIVTVSEGIAWARAHLDLDADNNPDNGFENATADDWLYVDAGQLDFGRLSISDFDAVGQMKLINLFALGGASFTNPTSSSIRTTYHLGRVHMTLLDSNGTVKIHNDNTTAFDWSGGGSLLRRAFITAERFRAGLNDRNGFPTAVYGTGRVRINSVDVSAFKYYR
ncbi:MAG: RHS repeat-associated core domain-containing protein [Bacteroidota bacterium]